MILLVPVPRSMKQGNVTERSRNHRILSIHCYTPLLLVLQKYKNHCPSQIVILKRYFYSVYTIFNRI